MEPNILGHALSKVEVVQEKNMSSDSKLDGEASTLLECFGESETSIIIIIIIIYNLYRGKAPVTRSDFQGGPLRVKIKYLRLKT